MYTATLIWGGMEKYYSFDYQYSKTKNKPYHGEHLSNIIS